MITTLTAEQLARIKASSTVGYAFEIKTTNDLYETVTSGTWLDVTSYVVDFPDIELQSEVTFNNQTFASQIELTLFGVAFWKDYFDNSLEFIEFRIRETQSDFTGVIDTFTIFGGRVYKSEAIYDELNDTVVVNAYNYMEYANRLPLWRIDTRYWSVYTVDPAILSLTDEYDQAFCVFADTTSSDKNFEGRFQIETSGGTERWNKGVYDGGGDLYDFRGDPKGKVTIETPDLNYELTIKYKNEGATVTDDYPFSPFFLTHYQRVIRQAMKEIGVDTDNTNYDPVYTDVLPRSAGYTPIELTYIKQPNESPTMQFTGEHIDVYFCQWGDTEIYYMDDDYDWHKYNIKNGTMSDAIATSTSPMVGRGVLGCSVYPDYTNNRIFFVWEEDYLSDTRVRASYIDLTDGTYGTELDIDGSADSSYRSWQLYIDNTYDYLGWIGLRGDGAGKLIFRWFDIVSETVYDSAALSYVYGGRTFENFAVYPCMWIVSGTETNIKVAALFYNDGGATKYYSLNTTDFDPSELLWTSLVGTDVFSYSTSTEGVYEDHCTCGTYGVFTLSSPSNHGTRSFPLSTLAVTKNSAIDYDIIIPVGFNSKIVGYTSAGIGYWTDLTLNSASALHNLAIGNPVGANDLFATSSISKPNTADVVFNSEFGLFTRSFRGTAVFVPTFVMAGEKFELFVTKINSSSGSVRDILNDMAINSGTSIHITDDKKLKVFKKFSDAGVVVTGGDLVEIGESDVKNVSKLDRLDPLDYVSVSDGTDTWTSDGTNVYPVALDSFSILEISSDILPNNLLDSISLSRGKLANQSFTIWAIELSYKNDRIEILDKISLSLSGYNTGLTGDGVVVGKVITETSTILNVMVKD